jgi:hypothetical protein
MKSDPQIILDTFHQYARTFEDLNPATVLPFYHYPATLISSEKTVAIKNWIEGFVIFTVVMLDLKWRSYDHSRTTSLSVRQLSENLAIVSGVVIRCRQDDTELERFGLTYTLRQVDSQWKIIVGMLHDVSV